MILKVCAMNIKQHYEILDIYTQIEMSANSSLTLKEKWLNA
jgi:hypothetical protein